MSDASVLIDAARVWANDMVGRTSDAMSAAKSAVTDITVPSVSVPPIGAPRDPPSDVNITVPSFDVVPLDLPTRPMGPSPLTALSPINAGAPPTAPSKPPALTMPNKPAEMKEFSGIAPVIETNIIFPTPPHELLYPNLQPPSINDRGAPTAPVTTLPEFSAVRPGDLDTFVDPSTQLDANRQAEKEQLTTNFRGELTAEWVAKYPKHQEYIETLQTRLDENLNYDRAKVTVTGLRPEVENAIYERSKGKVNAEALRVRDQSLNDAATRGFTMPGGALLSAVQQARQGGADNNAKAAAEIAVAQAELEQKNIHFSLTTSMALRKIVIDSMQTYFTNLMSINDAALSYAKTILSSVIEVYNAKVRYYTAQLEGFKADVFIYEAKVKAVMSSIELYKAEVAAISALVQVDHAKVGVYSARIAILTSLSNVYRAQIEATMGKVSMEKTKIELFQSQVQAYGAQVQAKQAELQGYTAAIGGEKAKVEVYAGEVQAYSSQVAGFKANIDALAAVLQGTIAQNEGTTRQYVASMNGYQTDVQAKAAVANSNIENQKQKLVSFQADIAAKLGRYQVQGEFYKATTGVSIANNKAEMEKATTNANLKTEYMGLLAKLSNSNAAVYGNLAGSAMAGMNSLATVSVQSSI